MDRRRIYRQKRPGTKVKRDLLILGIPEDVMDRRRISTTQSDCLHQILYMLCAAARPGGGGGGVHLYSRLWRDP